MNNWHFQACMYNYYRPVRRRCGHMRYRVTEGKKTREISYSMNKYHNLKSTKEKEHVFQVKNSWGCHPNLNYLLSSVISQDTPTCESNATTYAHTESMSTHSTTQAWAHEHRQAVHIFSFLWIVPHLELQPNRISAFSDLNILNAVRHTHTQVAETQ